MNTLFRNTTILLMLSFTCFTVKPSYAQIRKLHEITIKVTDLKNLRDNNKLEGSIVRVKQKTNEREVLFQLKMEDFPDNGKVVKVKLSKNESIEANLELKTRRNKLIESFHQTRTTEELNENPDITFTHTMEHWDQDWMGTKDFMKFLRTVIVNREQKAIMDPNFFTSLSTVPLGAFVFIDKQAENATDRISVFKLHEFETLALDESIPQDGLILSFNQTLVKEAGVDMDASFKANGVFAGVQAAVQNSDFVELSMNLKNSYKQYIQNIEAVHYNYLNENPDSIHPWFKTHLNTISNATDKNRYELHFTLGYKKLDSLTISYNTYTKIDANTQVDFEFQRVVQSNAGGKLMKLKKTKDYTSAYDYVVDVEMENLTTVFNYLAEVHAIKRQASDATQKITAQLAFAETKLSKEIQLFKASYNQFLSKYQDKETYEIDELDQLDCTESCADRAILCANDIDNIDCADLLESYGFYLEEKYAKIDDINRRSKLITSKQNTLHSNFDFMKGRGKEIRAIYGVMNYWENLLSNVEGGNFRKYLDELVASEEYQRSGTSIPDYFFN